MKKNLVLRLCLIHLPDILFLLYIAIIFFSKEKTSIVFKSSLYYIIFSYIVFRIVIITIFLKYYYNDRIKNIKDILTEFKKGRFTVSRKVIQRHDELGSITQELIIIGKYIDDIISALKSETEQFRELYNNIVFSISSYSVILNKKEEIIFTNDSFCKKFQLDRDEIISQHIEDIFFFITDKLKNAIMNVKTYEEPIVMEKIHLLSKSRVSVVADIKISKMLVQGEDQIILLIDDITSKCRKDYQMNLITQVTETIQRDDEIHRILYSILYAITSGEGLGFNRAMLFLLDEKKKTLVGEMSVGPDSLEEAIQIWNSIPPGGVDISSLVNTYNDPARSGYKLLDKVTAARFNVDDDNIFTKSFKTLTNIHIFNSWNDESVSKEIREFMDVNEFVIVPLIIEGRAIGIIAADNKFNQVPVSNDHLELLSIFAVQASLLIESYRSVTTLRKEMGKIKKRQEAMIESEKLAAIGRISSHIAHEIRNPLVTMGGYAKRIKQIAEGNEKVIKSADVILKETERLESILSNVMDITKPQTLIKKLNNINDAVSDTISLLKNVFLEKKIKIITDLNKKLPPVNSDFNQIKQVFINLLQNAIDATPPGGEVIVTTDTDSENIIISVKDTGTGIENGNKDSIFEPFFTTKTTGVGLGLSIVNKIIKDHNGDIKVKNRKSGGAEFTITLPIPL